MTTTYVGLGSNLGDRLQLLARAVYLLETLSLRVGALSSVYQSAPQGVVDQPTFLNLVVQAETDLSATALLRHTQAIEAELGRVRDVHWGPRTVDLDILLFGNQVLNLDVLQIPHPRMTERAFVLVPLLELNPGLVLPPNAQDRLVNRLSDLPDQGVELYMKATDFKEAHSWLRDI